MLNSDTQFERVNLIMGIMDETLRAAAVAQLRSEEALYPYTHEL
jgi:hypothetical protein